MFMPIFVHIRWSWFSISIFRVKKNRFFFGTQKSILKIKNSKKGLSSRGFASIYYMYAKGQVPTMIGFQSGRGGGYIIEGMSSYYGQTCIYIYIYICIYIYIYRYIYRYIYTNTAKKIEALWFWEDIYIRQQNLIQNGWLLLSYVRRGPSEHIQMCTQPMAQ